MNKSGYRDYTALSYETHNRRTEVSEVSRKKEISEMTVAGKPKLGVQQKRKSLN